MRNEETVKLISADGFEFVIDRAAAMVSKTLRNMLTSPGKRSHLSLTNI
jgi:elongin-C